MIILSWYPSVAKVFPRNMHFILIILIYNFVQPILSRECSIHGKCINSNGISTIHVSSVEECLIKCFITPNCEFSTFNFANYECSKFESCVDVDEDCMECWTNEKQCIDGM